MESVLKRAILRSEQPPHELLLAIREVCAQLDHVQARFEMECDGDLIDACIYEMEALRSRYRYLLRLAKDQGITAGGGTPLFGQERRFPGSEENLTRR